MLRKVSPVWSESLAGGGFLGCFEVDFTMNRARISGLAANVYGLLQKTGEQGADHTACCRAMHPDDFERLKDLRRGYPEQGGRWVFRSRMLNRCFEGGSHTWIEAHYTVELDTCGTPAFARGIVLDIDPLMHAGASAAACGLEPSIGLRPPSGMSTTRPRLRLIQGAGYRG